MRAPPSSRALSGPPFAEGAPCHSGATGLVDSRISAGLPFQGFAPDEIYQIFPKTQKILGLGGRRNGFAWLRLAATEQKHDRTRSTHRLRVRELRIYGSDLGRGGAIST